MPQKFAFVENNTVQDVVTNPQDHTDIALGNSIQSLRAAGFLPIHVRDPGPRTHPNTTEVAREQRSGDSFRVEERAVYRDIQYADRPLEEYRQALKQWVRDHRRDVERSNLTVTISGTDYTFSDPHELQGRLLGAIQRGNSQGGGGPPVPVVTVDDQYPDLSAGELNTLQNAISERQELALEHEGSLLISIDGAVSHDELDTIDITSGWP